MSRSLPVNVFLPLLGFWREARWLDVERGRVYGGLLAAALAIMTVWLLGSSFMGMGPGGDFLSFYAASRQALAGQAAAAWLPDLHRAVEATTIPGFSGELAFFYPPPYLLVCWPLAMLPFGAALLVWLVMTGAAALGALAAALRGVRLHARDAGLLLLAFPGFWINMSAGQNGALMLAILAGGFALLDRRPLLSGALLGMMVIKPQLALALPFVLAGAGRWKAFVSTAVAAAAYLVMSLLVVGPQGFTAFLDNLSNAGAALAGGVDPSLLQTVFALLLPVSPGAAAAGQIGLSLAVLAITVLVARRNRVDGLGLGALAVAGTLVASPFVLDYDLVVAALPLGWLVAQGSATGFRRWEKLGLVAMGLVPLITRELALHFGLHLGPLVLLWLFAAVAARLTSAPRVTQSGVPAPS
jgi:alpha-1,2-mannosyltransferase